MRLSGYQPQYFPRLHYFNRVLASDIFEISDYVQFVRKHAYELPSGEKKRGKSYQAHTPIKLQQGVFFLAVPTKDDLNPINKTVIDYRQNWNQKQLKSIEVGYSKAKNFKKYFPEITEILMRKYDNLAELNIKTVLWGILRMLGDEPISIDKLNIKLINKKLQSQHPFQLKKIFLASESPVSMPAKGKTNEWIIELCKYANAKEYYYGGTSHAAYMDLERIKKAGILPVLQDWNCREYTQQYKSAGFIPNMSIFDLILNADLDDRRSIIL